MSRTRDFSQAIIDSTLTGNSTVAFVAGTASSSNTTGTLVVTGGLGVSGNINNVYVGTGGSASNLTTNTAIGNQALLSLTGGPGNNAAIGFLALGYNTIGGQNSAIGSQVLLSSIIGSSNTGVGYGTLASTSTAPTALGTITPGSGYTNGSYTNVQTTYVSGAVSLLGDYPLVNVTVSGGVVSAVTLVLTLAGAGLGFTTTGTVLTVPAASIGGTGSGFSVPVSTITTGADNTGIGYYAGNSNIYGSNNTYVGYNVNPTSINFSNSTGLGNGASITASNQIVLGNTSVTQTLINGDVFMSAGTPSTTTSTGTLVVSGGAGISGAVFAGGNIQCASATGVVGYAAGSGGAVTQVTSRTTGVTLSKPTGAITLFTTTAVGGTWFTFTVTNTIVTAIDVVSVSVKSATNTYVACVSAVANGSFNISAVSILGTASDTPVINFAIIKGQIN